MAYKREFVKQVIVHFPAGKRSLTVFWKLPLSKGAGTRTKEVSILLRLVEHSVKNQSRVSLLLSSRSGDQPPVIYYNQSSYFN